jgi:hypothetical protein
MKRFVNIRVGLLLATAILPADAFAAGTPARGSAAAGTLMAAALETAGNVAQAQEKRCRAQDRLLAEIMQRDQKLRLDAMGKKAQFTVNFLQHLTKNITHPRTD